MMENYVVAKRSRAQIRGAAVNLRKALCLENTLYFPIVEVLDQLSLVFEGFNYSIENFSGTESDLCARTYPDLRYMEIDEFVYDSASEGEGRDRFTIGHELGHIFLHSDEYSLDHKPWNDSNNKIYESSEWQANCFAGELLIPKSLVLSMDISSVISKCGVSYDAAKTQMNAYHKEFGKGDEMNNIRDHNKKLFD